MADEEIDFGNIATNVDIISSRETKGQRKRRLYSGWPSKEARATYQHEYYLQNKQKFKDYQAANKDSIQKQRKAFYDTNREKLLWKQKEYRYGITAEKIHEMVMRQDGLCPICFEILDLSTPKGFHVDHNHETGKIRGVLCIRCNRLLVAAFENPLAPFVQVYIARDGFNYNIGENNG